MISLAEVNGLKADARDFAILLAQATGQPEWRDTIEAALDDFGRLHAELVDIQEKVRLPAIQPALEALLATLEDDDG